MTIISQREARRLRKRVQELESIENRRRNAWGNDYPGGVNLCNISVNSDVHAQILTARKLKHAVVVTSNGDGAIQFYALPLSK